jgi:hypothetical protein
MVNRRANSERILARRRPARPRRVRAAQIVRSAARDASARDRTWRVLRRRPGAVVHDGILAGIRGALVHHDCRAVRPAGELNDRTDEESECWSAGNELRVRELACWSLASARVRRNAAQNRREPMPAFHPSPLEGFT